MKSAKVLKVISCLFVLFLLVGCGKENAKVTNEGGVVVEFNNSKYNITADELYQKLKDEYGTSFVVEMVDTRLLNDLYETDDAANKYADSQIELYEQVYGGEQELLQQLQNYGYSSIDDFKEKNILLSYKRGLATDDYIRKNLSEDEIKEYYESNIIGDITASHILVKVNVDSSASDEDKKKAEDTAKATIKEIYEKLEKGEDFHDLAKTYSDDTANASNGGRLGTFTYGEMESSFEKACIELKVGEYNKEAVKTSYGYHIILKEDEKAKPELKTVREYIIGKLISAKKSSDSTIQNKALVELRKENGIKINDEDLNTKYDNAVNNWLYGSSN